MSSKTKKKLTPLHYDNSYGLAQLVATTEGGLSAAKKRLKEAFEIVEATQAGFAPCRGRKGFGLWAPRPR